MRSVIRLTLVFLSVLSFSSPCKSQATFAEESLTKIDLREAVFRYMFEHYNYGPYVKVYCIAPERPLPESFLGRFSQVKPHVVWDSECDNSGAMNGVRHKKTGEAGMRMAIIDIQWIRGDEAMVKVEAFSDGIAANWNSLKVVLNLKENRWKVVKDKLEGQS